MGKVPQNDEIAPNVGVPQGLHVLAEPIGPVCYIKCEYCFRLEKHALVGKGENFRMPGDVL